LLFPGTKSVIVTGLNYYTAKKQTGNDVPVISRYAYGANYHDLIIAKLNKIIDFIKTIHPGAGCKSFVDSAPLLEKAWARKAGLGWPGKHSVLINRHIGSFFFLGIILTDLELENDIPNDEDLCGTCSLCIQACPTEAINGNRTIDTRKCIACLTIESKLPVDENIVPKLQKRIFGCDICQEVCPWNRRARQHSVDEFEPSAEFLAMTAEEWENLSLEKFKMLFKNTAIGRKKYDVFMKNVTNVTKKK
jgi:epoxyqueuosine reductase